jgi:RNA polymerase sigma-70 factor (ECF subfamily)
VLATPHAELESERPYLMGVAYRLLGSASDAEDVVQEALLRAAGASDLVTPRAYLTTVVTRLCIDELRSARRRRETYVGPWLPEPLLTPELDAPSTSAFEHKENVSFAFLVLLDQLSPLERAAFVLREVFVLDFDEIARTLQRSEAACRKLVSRAKAHLEARRGAAADTPASAPAQLAVAGSFFQALATGDLNEVIKLLAGDVFTTTDHGGKATAAQNSLLGPDRVARFFLGLIGKGLRSGPKYTAQIAYVNGAPTLLASYEGNVISAMLLHITQHGEQAHITSISIVRNPDKLRSLQEGVTLPGVRAEPHVASPA